MAIFQGYLPRVGAEDLKKHRQGKGSITVSRSVNPDRWTVIHKRNTDRKPFFLYDNSQGDGCHNTFPGEQAGLSFPFVE
jgi:hypothetical protein